MKVFITGAGLLGAHAAEVLVAKGRTVTLYDAAPDEGYVRSVVRSGDVRVETGDVTNLATLVDSVRDSDIVVHTAGLIGPLAQRAPHTGFTVNVVGTLNVAEAARLAGATRLVYASTHGVYDFDASADRPMTEAASTHARAVYAASKLSSEHVLQAYSAAYALDVIVLRFCNLFGRGLYAAGSRGGETFNALVASAVSGETARIASPLAGRGEWLYAKDAARAVAAAVAGERTRGFTVVNVGSGRLTGPDDLIAAVRREIPNARFERAGEPGRERRQPFDLRTAKEVLGWEPAYSLESAVADYVADVRARRSRAATPLS